MTEKVLDSENKVRMVRRITKNESRALLIGMTIILLIHGACTMGDMLFVIHDVLQTCSSLFAERDDPVLEVYIIWSEIVCLLATLAPYIITLLGATNTGLVRPYLAYLLLVFAYQVINEAVLFFNRDYDLFGDIYDLYIFYLQLGSMILLGVAIVITKARPLDETT